MGIPRTQWRVTTKGGRQGEAENSRHWILHEYGVDIITSTRKIELNVMVSFMLELDVFLVVDPERSLSLAGREALQGSTHLEAHWFWAGGVDL